jgi:hypothetical protein
LKACGSGWAGLPILRQESQDAKRPAEGVYLAAQMCFAKRVQGRQNIRRGLGLLKRSGDFGEVRRFGP